MSDLTDYQVTFQEFGRRRLYASASGARVRATGHVVRLGTVMGRVFKDGPDWRWELENGYLHHEAFQSRSSAVNHLITGRR